MFETNDFRSQLEDAISQEAARQGLTHYQNQVVDYLRNLASDNEGVLMERELRKAVGARRGVQAALDSARVLVESAAVYAAADKRTTLQLGDMQKAYAFNFCKIWPFCK